LEDDPHRAAIIGKSHAKSCSNRLRSCEAQNMARTLSISQSV
jgi:hypothetical protein